MIGLFYITVMFLMACAAYIIVKQIGLHFKHKALARENLAKATVSKDATYIKAIIVFHKKYISTEQINFLYTRVYDLENEK